MRERKIRLAGSGAKLFGALALGSYVIAAVLFTLKMKELGFSLPELGVIFVTLALLGFWLGSILIQAEVPSRTLALASAVAILLALALAAGMTVMLARIKDLFALG